MSYGSSIGEAIKRCAEADKLLYSKHALDEMDAEEFGEIGEDEVFEVLSSGRIIEEYPDDEPYSSCLLYGRTAADRPLHVVCAFAEDADMVIIITVYQPDPARWIDFERRRA